ncbi:MAG TPA: ATP synthase F1 subunit delta [Candidatus Acidoferrales bacterium]|nr:ATP synthase F1 subunit delta [Candidatus Acidoferrales bacterium]
MSALAQRYAAALADVAFERNEAEKIRRDLADFAQVFAESADLRNLLANPSVSADAKKSVAGEIAAKMGTHPEVRNFIFVVIDHGRTGIVKEIQQAFETEMNRRLGIVDAVVISAHELSAAEKSRLTQSLEGVTGKKVQSQYQLNPQLIGGATVRIGSTIYDGSVREQLNRLRAQLESQ